jgi:hypothetical protein
MQVSVYTTHDRDSLSCIPVRITLTAATRTSDPDLELSCRSAARVPRASKVSQTRSVSYLIKYTKGVADAKLNVEEEIAETCAKYSLSHFTSFLHKAPNYLCNSLHIYIQIQD